MTLFCVVLALVSLAVWSLAGVCLAFEWMYEGYVPGSDRHQNPTPADLKRMIYYRNMSGGVVVVFGGPLVWMFLLLCKIMDTVSHEVVGRI